LIVGLSAILWAFSVGWEIRRNLLIRNGAFIRQLEKILRSINDVVLTLNQRVHGSSPCAPTNKFNQLADFDYTIPTGSQALIPTN
jgi:hypothetical protein